MSIATVGVQDEPVAPVERQPQPMVAVRDLVKRFGDVEAVRGVSFNVAPGEAFAFLGPNGAGKPTTISILCTLLQPSSGEASVAGFDVLEDPLGCAGTSGWCSRTRRSTTT